MTNGHAAPLSQPPQPWGHLSTFAWALLAALASAAAGAVALALFFPDGGAPADLMKDARLFGWLSLAALAGELLVLVIAAKVRGWSAWDYLGLKKPSPSELVFGVAVTVAMTIVLDSTTWLLGRDVVTPFQVEAYNSARQTGAWLPLLLAVVVGAPIGEELMFRGFMFRGWAQTPSQVWPTIIVTSLLWALMHSQYDWFGIGQIFIIGLVLGWLRWASGSALLTTLLHGLINAWATIQTIFVMEFLRA
jgi:membrane protease YdiL (CAAX protease family)